MERKMKERIQQGKVTKEDVIRRLAELAFARSNDCVTLVLAEKPQLSRLDLSLLSEVKRNEKGLVEIKLGGDKLIEEGSVNLKALSNKIDTDKMKKPAFLMVLTGTGDYAYRRPDGVYVVPIGCLKD